MEMFEQALNQELYGNQRTRTFAEIYPSADDFSAAYKANPFATRAAIVDPDIEFIYYLLYANYGNSSICSSDEYRFSIKLFSLIYQYAPTYLQKVTLQQAIRATENNGFKTGGKAIYNMAANPNIAPSTSALEELPYINNQNTTNYIKSDAEAYQIKWSLLDDSLESEFINKFRNLFIKIVNPTVPLWYPEVAEQE